MQEIFTTLKSIEASAFAFYDKASAHFSDDPGLRNLLKKLASEEKEHQEMLAIMSEISGIGDEIGSIVSFDKETTQNIKETFTRLGRLLENNELSKEELLECVITVEYSEWNDIFTLLVNSIKKDRSDFVQTASKLQNHKRGIERFIEANSEYSRLLERTKLIPDAWTDKILVVDDEDIIVEILRAILVTEGEIDCASNGEEALEKLSNNYYSAIVSDVNMPRMDGVEFYKEAVKSFPNINKRFLFFTGSLDPERHDYFEANGLMHIHKPAPLGQIRNAVIEIMARH